MLDGQYGEGMIGKPLCCLELKDASTLGEQAVVGILGAMQGVGLGR